MIIQGEVRVDLRPVASLLPHEDTIPEQLEKIAAQIRREGIQKDPLIVDRDSGAVLDGMHRLGAFVKLGLENIVCCLVDYSSPGIQLNRWARVYRTTQGKMLEEALDGMGLDRPATMNEAFGALEERTCGLAAVGSRGCKIGQREMGLSEAFRQVRSLDEVSRVMGWQRTFIREDEVDIALQDDLNTVVMLQRLTKQDVLNAARSGRLFPCKSSMHLIDPRPVALDFPVADLNAATSKTLADLLGKRNPLMLPPNSEYEGRRYKERLLLLDSR